MARLILILLLTLGQSTWPVLASWSAPICHDPASGVCAPEPTPADEPIGCCPSAIDTSIGAPIDTPTPLPPIGCPMTGDDICTCGVAPMGDLPFPTVPAQPRAEHTAALVALLFPMFLGSLDWDGSRSPRVAADQPRPPRPHRTIQASIGVWRN